MLRALVMLLILPHFCGCRSLGDRILPSNYRDWSPDQAVLAEAEYVPGAGDLVKIRNVRDCLYLNQDAYVLNYCDKTYRLRDLRGVDFFVAPFPVVPFLAHTMLSFEFVEPDGRSDHLAVSVEIRREKGERFSLLGGFLRKYELMYVVASERDVVQLRTNLRKNDVYHYRSTASPEQAQALFLDVMARANQLAERPEFYDTLMNNCTTNIVGHINRLRPDRIAYDWRVLMPGYSDHLAYEEGLIVPAGSFEETRRLAYLNDKASRFDGSGNFSELIRR